MAKLLQDYLRTKGINSIQKDLSIDVKRHSKYNELVLFKYDQINSPMGNPVVQQCRGTILDESNDWKVISFPYTKFFNYGEGHAAKIDWSTARVYEKLDGSLMTLYHYDNQWQVSSSGLPDAAGNVQGFNFNFAELFWKVWKDLNYSLPRETNYCFMFELMTQYNRVVVRHKTNDIVLHGVRRLTDYKELNPVIEAHNNNWKCAKIYPLTSWEEINDVAKTIDPMEGEGFIVCDVNYNRVKVKTPQYVALSHLKDSISSSQRQLIEKIRNNDHEEFLIHFPEFKDEYFSIKSKYERLLGRIEGFYDGIKHIQNQKEFALLANGQKYSGALFSLRNNKSKDAKHYLAEMNIKNLENWLGLKSVD